MEIQEAQELLQNISTLNTEIAKLDARIQDKKVYIENALKAENVSSIEELELKISKNQEILDKLLEEAKINYESSSSMIEEAKQCLMN